MPITIETGEGDGVMRGGSGGVRSGESGGVRSRVLLGLVVMAAINADAAKAPCPLSHSVMAAGRTTMAPRCLQHLLGGRLRMYY